MGDETHMVTASKVPMLKQGEYEIWKMRVRQYIRMIDYKMWDIILKGNQSTVIVDGKEVPVKGKEAEDQKKLEIKAHSILMMGIPNEFQLDFETIETAKELMEAVETRFGGNDATKKSRKNALKHQFENFTSSSGERLDGTYNRLQKLVSQLKLVGYIVPQEDINLKFLRSLSSEWSMHTVVWRNKADFDTMSLDDLYNNLKAYESEMKGAAASSTSSSDAQNIAFVSTKGNNSSDTHSAAYGVSAASTGRSVAGSSNSDTVSDIALCAFLADLTTGPQV